MDWKALAPHKPLGGDDPLHVPRPMGDGRRLASMMRAGLGPFAVAGPVGSGKSTEIATAAEELRLGAEFFALDLSLDQVLNMRQITGADLLWVLGGSIFEVTRTKLQLQLEIPDEARSRMTGKAPSHQGHLEPGPYRDAFLAVIREFKKKSPASQVAILVDGLEKCPEEQARSAVRTFLSLKDEVELAFVVPPSLVIGPANAELLSELRVFPIRPVPVIEQQGSHWKEGRQFLADIFRRRMGKEDTNVDALKPLLETAAISSGGLPRTFLQLMRDAGGYATVANRELPTREDLDNAMRDQTDSLRRLLRDGDMKVMRVADGSDGLEIPIERRVRLLSHGILLENEVDDRVIVKMHPLLAQSDGEALYA
ncbi:hypothetical protein [Archangium lansingense]|uniref:AAA ATPase-like protein n=1 Tax=Archangium lansingense TaxID=2995310 RepID=A0ABT3ZUK5_9BACT|nr:hypothetical protein [Archangium lansinium]MCY1073088.1 hypothetical protein [Archangium lansinium]